MTSSATECAPNRKLLALLFCAIFFADTVQAELAVQRLTWAGVKLVSGDTTVVIDAVGTDIWDGNAPDGLVDVTSSTARTYALVTHTHNDHFDVATLKSVLGERGYVICHESQATYIASRGLRVIPAKMFVPVFRGGFIFTAVPAEDGFGAQQVSWVVSNGSQKILHGGDTLWHGQWQNIGRHFGPFDAVFLPINGARLGGKDAVTAPESGGVQNPQQAVDAALLLRAELLVPIHFGANDPPNYVEVEEPRQKTAAIAKRRGQPYRHLRPGDRIILVDGGETTK